MNFDLLGKFHARELYQDLRVALTRNPDLWDLVTARQDYPGSAHKDTRAIILRWPANNADSWNDVPTVDMPWIGELPVVHEIFAAIEFHWEVRVVRALIAELKPGGHITPHIDEGAHAAATRRMHLVLRSARGNVFKCGGECIEPAPNDLFFFSHHKTHEVWNHSEEPRWHLIMDVKS